nr:TMEM165/GDT1 family protein [Desulfurivibrio alkaliphilus]
MTTFVLFFLTEMGDKTQIATAIGLWVMGAAML